MIKIEHEDIIIRTYMLFLHIAYMVQKYSNSRLEREARISAVKYRALRVLVNNGGAMRPSEMSKRLFREPHNSTTLIDRLSREGFVTTERDGRDRRSVNITITDKGREILAHAKPVSREIVNQVMSSISKEDAATLEKLLGVLAQNLDEGT